MWTYLSVRHWDEPAVGEWTLRISDVAGAGTGTLNGATIRFTGVSATKPIFNDWDGDGDVDLSDFIAFQGCFTGSGGTATLTCREAFDADGDDDVDLMDDIIFDSNVGRTAVPAPILIDSDPPNNWIDPLSQCEDASDTNDRIGKNRPIVLTFDRRVFDQHGFDLDPEDFAVVCTEKYKEHDDFKDNPCSDGAINPPTNPCPGVATIAVSGDGKTVTVTLDNPIPYGEWTKLTTTVQNAAGVETPVVYYVAHLPCDVNQDREVDSTDSDEFMVQFRAFPPPPELVDTNRDGTVNISDPGEFGRLYNGWFGFIPWNGKSLDSQP